MGFFAGIGVLTVAVIITAFVSKGIEGHMDSPPKTNVEVIEQENGPE